MPEYYYQIKGKKEDGSWTWPPLYSGKIIADTSSAAREELAKEHGIKLPMTGLKGEKGKMQQFLLCLDDMTCKPYLQERFIQKECKRCGIVFTLNEKYLLNEGGSREYCSGQCSQEVKTIEVGELRANFDFTGIHRPVIYKITCKPTGLCYIGKTTQAFTLRWYQHFFQGGAGEKFYEAKNIHKLTDWTFEVIEEVVIPEEIKYDTSAKNRLILERESYYIKYFDSIKNGYNSVISKKEEIEDSQQDLFQS